uniref:BTB domain-containing protein n=1 Tax=Arcella intermedia TaxID=1963864 RepID=A0A6B2L5H6_9EUKA
MFDDETADVVFVVEKQKIPAHRCILAKASLPFKSMFFGGMRESKEKEVAIGNENVSPDCFKVFLEYIYTRVAPLTTDNLFPLLNLSKMYEIMSLQQQVQDHLIKLATPENAILLLQKAYTHKEQGILEALLKIISYHTKESLQQSSFLQIQDPEVLELITQLNTMAISELDLFMKMVQWIKHNNPPPKAHHSSHSSTSSGSQSGSSSPHIQPSHKKILSNIRYACISKEDLVTLVKPTMMAPNELYVAALEYHCAPSAVEAQLEPFQAMFREFPTDTDIGFLADLPEFRSYRYEFAIAQAENAGSHKEYAIVEEGQFKDMCPFFLLSYHKKRVLALDSFLSTNWAVRIASGKHIKFPSGFLSLQKLEIQKGEYVSLQLYPSFPLPTSNFWSYNVTFAGGSPGTLYPVLCIKKVS